MILSIDINNITKPFFKEYRRGNMFVRFLIQYFEKYLEKRIKTFNDTLDRSILMIEGVQDRLKDLDQEKAKEFLKSMSKVIDQMEIMYKECEKDNFLDKPELKKKFKYLLKCLYKSESIVYKIAFNETKTNKIESSIKDGVFNLTSDYLNKAIAK